MQQFHPTWHRSPYRYKHFLNVVKVDSCDRVKDAKEEIISTLAETKANEDTTLSAKAMIALREKYGFKIVDSEIKQYYERYINNQVNKK